MPHDPFNWVHSGFGFVTALIAGTVAFHMAKDVTISGYYEYLIALNALFWFKQYTNRKVEADKEIKLASVGGINAKVSKASIGSPINTGSVPGSGNVDTAEGQQRD